MASSCVSLWIDADLSLSSRISLTSLARYRYVILLQLADVEAFCTCVSRMCLPPNSEPRQLSRLKLGCLSFTHLPRKKHNSFFNDDYYLRVSSYGDLRLPSIYNMNFITSSEFNYLQRGGRKKRM